MSRDDERGRSGPVEGEPASAGKSGGRAAAAKNPFLEEATPGVRQRRHKPPAGIISAGGVDMARAHASGIRLPEGVERKSLETRKVVVAVETDPRRVPTHPRMRDKVAARPGTLVARDTPVGAAPRRADTPLPGRN